MLSASIRPALESDLDGIASIYNHEVLHGTATFDTETKSSRDVGAWLLRTDPRHPAIVAVDDSGGITGFAGLYPWSPRKAYERTVENTVYVRPGRRGQGIGRALLRELLRRGESAGVHAVIARISSGNEASVRLHRELGFVTIGTMKEVGTKFGRLLDVELMQLIFSGK